MEDELTPETGDLGGLDAEAAVLDFVLQLREDVERGAVQPLADYLARFPGADRAIAAEYVAVLPDQPDATLEPPDARANQGDAEQRTIDAYVLLRPLGQGGQGTVYLARDTRLDRLVALKVLPHSLSAARAERFRREVRIISQLDHERLCSVYDANVDTQPFYVAMRYARGRSIDRVLEDARSRTTDSGPRADDLPCPPRDGPELRRLLRFFEQAASALHAAHEAGVVHRDVKPGNVIATEAGEPFLVDFGLAQSEQSGEALTRTGDVLGTPSYMSPEQVLGGRGGVDRRTDVYSLAVTLYECATLERPFTARDGRLVEESILHDPTPDPRRVNAALPDELAVVIATATAKDPGERYPTALAFAEDLRRIRCFEPIRARTPSPGVRAKRWVQRNRAVAAATAAIVALLATGLAVTVALLFEVRREAEQKQSRILSQAALDAANERPELALRLALEAAERAPGVHANDALLAALGSYRSEFVFAAGADARPDLHPLDPSLAAIPEGNAVTLRDLEGAGEPRRFEGHAGTVRSVAFAPDGRRLVSTAAGEGTRVWDVVSGRCSATLADGSGDTERAVLGPGGASVATVGAHEVRCWDAESGALLLTRPRSEVQAVAFDVTGSLALVSAAPSAGGTQGRSAAVEVWDVARGSRRGTLDGHTDWITKVVASADGRWLATASLDGTVQLWSAATFALHDVIQVPGEVHAVDFDRAGERLAVGWAPQGNERSGAGIFDVASGSLLVALAGHEYRPVSHVEFASDGARLLTASWNLDLRLWDAATGTLLDTLPVEDAIRSVDWGPQDRRILCVGPSASSVFNLERPGPLPVLAHDGPVRSIAFDRAGARVLTASSDGTAALWDATSGERLVSVGSAGGAALVVAGFDDGGRRFVTAGVDGVARVWDASTGELRRTLEPHGAPLTHARFLPADGALFTAAEDGTLRLTDPETGAALHTWIGPGGAPGPIAHSPDGRRIALGWSGPRVTVTDVEMGATELVLDLPTALASHVRSPQVFDLRFSADGGTLVIATQDECTLAVDVATGATLGELRGNYGFVRPLRDGGDILCTAKWRSVLVRWNPVSGERRTWSPLHTNRIDGCVVAADESLALTFSLDGTTQVWDLPTLAPRALLRGHSGPVFAAALDPTGRLIATASQDSTARLWPTRPIDRARAIGPRALRLDERATYGL